MRNLLPLGTVVLLKESTKRLMIIGRLQQIEEHGKIFDYCGCLFPEGHLGPNQVYVFDNDTIEEIYFRGFEEDDEEKRMVKQLNAFIE